MNHPGKGCILPFTQIEITSNGDIFPCCRAYNSNYSFGNLYKNTLEEIWYGEKAKLFRNKIRNNDYEFCDLAICMTRKDGDLPDDADLQLPAYVKFSHDSECNVACIMCRNSIVRHSKARLDELNNSIDSIFIPALANAKLAYCSGAGDPFASRHMRRLIRRATEVYPDLKFDLQSNGQLCNKAIISSLGIEKRINTIQISIHAASESTYKKIIPQGNFLKLKENMLFLAGLHQKGLINQFNAVFVIQDCNVGEIYDFAEWITAIGGRPLFWIVRNQNHTPVNRKWDENDILNPAHPKYKLCINELDRTYHSFGKLVTFQQQLKDLMVSQGATNKSNPQIKDYLKKLVKKFIK